MVGQLSQYFSEPTEEEWVTVKHVMRHLKGSPDKELCFRTKDNEALGFVAYSDADGAADATDRCSTTAYCVSLRTNTSLVSWKTNLQ